MKLTPDVINKLVHTVKVSDLPLRSIAWHCGITYQTLRNWLRNGEANLKKLTDGVIKKGDLNTKQKREIELYDKFNDARTESEMGMLGEIKQFAREKKDAKTLMWFLRVRNKDYRDNANDDDDDDSSNQKVPQVVVVNLSSHDGEAGKLLTEFIDGSKKNAKEDHSSGTSDSGES